SAWLPRDRRRDPQGRWSRSDACGARAHRDRARRHRAAAALEEDLMIATTVTEQSASVAPTSEHHPIPADVAAFRTAHRAEHIGPRYRGWLHFATTNVGALLAIGIAVWQVHAP